MRQFEDLGRLCGFPHDAQVSQGRDENSGARNKPGPAHLPRPRLVRARSRSRSSSCSNSRATEAEGCGGRCWRGLLTPAWPCEARAKRSAPRGRQVAPCDRGCQESTALARASMPADSRQGWRCLRWYAVLPVPIVMCMTVATPRSNIVS